MTDFSPREIVSELDRFIVGQKAAKRAVAIALQMRFANPEQIALVVAGAMMTIRPPGSWLITSSGLIFLATMKENFSSVRATSSSPCRSISSW